jgi:hypothetical protein
VRARVVLVLALAVVVGALALDMSGRAPRTAGSDHVGEPIFAATVPGGATVCQAVSPLPGDAARAQLLIGTYGHPVPALSMRFLAASGEVVATGLLPAGAHEGAVTIPLTHVRAGAASTNMCLHVGGKASTVIGGEGIPISASAEQVNGKQQPGRIGLLYFRSGEESWWQLLPTLSTRFGLGKAPFFGGWTLPFAALLLLGVWAMTMRLLWRELR